MRRHSHRALEEHVLAIEATGLTKHFGPTIRAVDGIDLRVEEGQIFGFLGQNGSGKTTTVRMLATLTRPTAGTARVAGVDVLANPAEVRRRVGVALQEVGLDELQTGRELLELQGRLFGQSAREARERAAHLLEVVGLADVADRPIRGYSGGTKRRLDLACALVHGPRVVFLDEPTTGLDPVSRDAVWRYIEELNRGQGVTVFLTTQYLEEADRLADTVAIMDQGKIVAQGPPGELKASIGTDSIMLTFEAEEAAARAAAVLGQFEGVQRVLTSGQEVAVYLHDGASAVAAIVRLLDEAGAPTQTLVLKQPTLDDVFLQVTGHHLDVEDARPAAPSSGRNA
ncbi:ATP-binding cassette domain-containing protein [Tepidiforma sp.]|uniref:ATP-binding cassette domain-containing protein n=1 Tax=Tepidiforma sp. TaxID=2682230 RepID=UPI00260AE761|nr:ATP-binding cassette domain-containing protein [Tepidiforma sp.]MCX7618668.1 ATP-binding cassette domain-containing protein [Tepidiforma sp.]